MKIAGYLFIVLGLLAILFPLGTGLVVEIGVGCIVLLAGAVHWWDSYRFSGMEHRSGHLYLAATLIIGGLLLLFSPMIGIAAFTLLLALAFIIQGALQLYFVFANKVNSNRQWHLINGLIALLVGTLIMVQWPSSALWLVGIMVGLNLIFLGVTCLTSKITIDMPR